MDEHPAKTTRAQRATRKAGARPEKSFKPVSHRRNEIKLTCIRPCALTGSVTALVNGIEIGHSVVTGTFDFGDALTVRVQHFPKAALPAKVRFALGDDEFCPPYLLSTTEDVTALVGYGEIQIDDLTIDRGLLTGTIINESNGSDNEQLYAVVNGGLVRNVIIEHAQPIANGKHARRFVVPIRPNDLLPSGIFFEIRMSGVDFPVATYAYAKSDLTSESRKLIDIEEQLRQLQKTFMLQIALTAKQFEERVALQQERIDSFVEYAMSLLLDNIAGEAKDVAPSSFLASMRELSVVADSPLEKMAATVSYPPAEVPLSSTALAFGWYDLEKNEFGLFRWMGKTSLIRNPHPDRAIRSVRITIVLVYGCPEPKLRGMVDDKTCVVKVERLDRGFLARIDPPGGSAMFGEALIVESSVVGCPATDEDTDTTDSRVLSIAVTKIEFHFVGTDA